MYGFRDEAALYDNTFQQYGQILDHERRRLRKAHADRQPVGGLDAAPDTGKVSVMAQRKDLSMT